jgi:hypothetical protein
MKTKSTITVKNKAYPYTLEKTASGSIHVIVRAARINQEFLPEDVPSLIIDLPKLILAEQQYQETQDAVLRFRVSSADKYKIEKRALSKGYSSVSKYLKDVALGS